jgi:ribosome-interacting GTPase 1
MEAMCRQIHHHLTKEFKYALVWGVSAKHSPQRVGLTHQLSDEDVVQVGCYTLTVTLASLCQRYGF